MIKNPNKFKNKFITIALSVFFTALFVFIGANASFLGIDADGVEGLRVDGGAVIDGGLEIGKGLESNQNAIKIYNNSTTTPNFSVKADGVITNSPTIREIRGANLNCDKGLTLAKKWNAQTWKITLNNLVDFPFDEVCSVKEGWAMGVPSCVLYDRSSGPFDSANHYPNSNWCVEGIVSNMLKDDCWTECNNNHYVTRLTCHAQNWSDVICIGE